MSPTREQVAARAKVSITTYSRWRRDPQSVPARTRKAIETAVEQLEVEAKRPSFAEMLAKSERMIEQIASDVALLKRLAAAEATAKAATKGGR